MNRNYENIILQCADCGCEFDFSPEEQEFYAEKGFSTPKRCASCRSRNRQRKNEKRGGGGSNRPQVRYDVTCSACGVKTTVPFKPNQDKPLYCPDCYRSQRQD
ncbi:MAG TPA: zinc-ribbon domain containing protein [Candidatus Gastranaerophilales bacterium]|nr:zinc-ribbon domain containing protein [Candidatus Gastranaerophilales bacterium]